MGKPGQLDLFGQPPQRAGREVGPAPAEPELHEVAAAIPQNVYLGTSSWSFPGWEGLVYDRAASPSHLARRGLAAYAQHPLLRAVGIDRTYYAPLPASAFAEYAAAVPSGFRFLVKACSECTAPFRRAAGGRSSGPNELYLHANYATDEIVGPLREGLAEKAGPLVFQFPPQGGGRTRDPAGFAERLERFLSALPTGPAYAVELRDRELLTDEYFTALERTGVRHCLSLHPRLPPVAAQRPSAANPTAGPLIVRWMLHRGLDYEAARRRYEPFSRIVDEDPESREWLADRCVEAALGGQDVVVIANNKAEGSAPQTVFRLARSVAARLGRP